jgi:phosphoglycolate phosphatase
MSFKAVVFDLDGTLLDTLQDLADACNRVLAHHDFPVHPVAAYRYFVGDGLQTLIERIVPAGQSPEVIGKLLLDFMEDYQQNWNVQSCMYAGIDQMLDSLQAAGLTLSVLSNKPHEFTVLCVEQLLPAWQFSPVFGARSEVPKKPDPAGAVEIANILQLDPTEILYLGDTATDMKTAKGAGMFAVGVLWGFRTEEELKQSGADRVIASPINLLELL